MKTKKVVGKIFDAINYSKKLKISSILPDRDSDYVILLELEDGSKFEIIIIPTATNTELLLEEQKKELESDLERVIQKGRCYGISDEDIKKLFELILEG